MDNRQHASPQQGGQLAKDEGVSRLKLNRALNRNEIKQK